MSHPAIWYADRGAGLVALLLLTVAVVLGVISVARVHSERWPRFALADLHRNIALLALVFGVVHVVSSVVDTFVPITVTDAFIPFGSQYKAVWLALGTIGADMMLAVLVTTALRRRIGSGIWRSVHFLSYGCWATSVVHAIAMGSDARTAVWGVMAVAACTGAVGGAVVQRTATRTPTSQVG